MSRLEMEQILENAIDSIVAGVEDFENGDKYRIISAIRNIHAGILLLGKCCLLKAAPNEDPGLVLAQSFKISLDSAALKIKIIPKDKKTIDFWNLEERFKAFNLEWNKDIKILNKLRNAIEHKYSQDSDEIMAEVIASSFPAIVHFFNILDLDPSELLQEVWHTMVQQEGLYRSLRKDCMNSFSNITWANESIMDIECPNCSSQLLYQENSTNSTPQNMEIKCKACGESFSESEFVESFVASNFDDTIDMMEGGQQLVFQCHNCSYDTCVRTNKGCYCYFCEEELGKCEGLFCGNDLLTPDIVSFSKPNTCNYCDERMHRDD